MVYDVDFTEIANEGLLKLKKSDVGAYNKLLRLLEELREHPTTGTGKPEVLKGDQKGRWSRRITDKHRLVYEINGKEIVVLVISVYGHYDDK